jgi:hypothetical protein
MRKTKLTFLLLILFLIGFFFLNCNQNQDNQSKLSISDSIESLILFDYSGDLKNNRILKFTSGVSDFPFVIDIIGTLKKRKISPFFTDVNPIIIEQNLNLLQLKTIKNKRYKFYVFRC